MDEQLAAALMGWCGAVAHCYKLRVHNLTTALADGRILCLLVHYYYPTLLPHKEIKKTAAHGKTVSAAAASTSLNQFGTDGIEPKALEREHRNFATLRFDNGSPSISELLDSTIS